MAKRQKTAKGGAQSSAKGKTTKKQKATADGGERPFCDQTTTKGHPCGNRAKAGETMCASHLKLGGRPSKFTDDTRKAIIGYIKIGNYQAHAARAAGVHPDTLNEWLREGEADIAAGKSSTPKAEFSEACTRAKDEAISLAVGYLRKGMKDDWRAAVAFLERKDPDHWGKRQRIEHVGEGGGPVKTQTVNDLSNLSIAEREQFLALRKKIDSQSV